jgi:1,4-dihydroxy-6-naphthoate synthase
MTKISLGHTPDADDAFMFYGIASGKVSSPDFQVEHVIEDIESLNKRALRHELDVTAVSAHAFAYLKDYAILRSGGSFGINYGPIVISKKGTGSSRILQGKNISIAIPGKMTSANLLLMLAIGKFDAVEMSFETIPDAVLSGKVDAGLVIHEAQITYDRMLFESVFDIASWWSNQFSSLPVPLGINVASTSSMPRNLIVKFSDLFHRSIKYGLENIDAAVEYAMQYGRGNAKATITKFVKMYVNDYTLDMGLSGKKSIEQLLERAKKNGILQGYPPIDVI